MGQGLGGSLALPGKIEQQGSFFRFESNHILLGHGALLGSPPSGRRTQGHSKFGIFQYLVDGAVVPHPGETKVGIMPGRIDAQPVPSDSAGSLNSALSWLLTAHQAAGRQGISGGYDLVRRSWKPSYPETTGYIIPTLLECARTLDDCTYSDLGLLLADYELTVQSRQGAIPSMEGYPIVFDTGQVIFGWLAAWRQTGQPRYWEAATRAAHWLSHIQSPNGSWDKCQHLNLVKVIDTRVAWALLQVDEATSSPTFEQAARRNLDWALSQQHANGWFSLCALRPGQRPITHTLAYTVEGLLESGLILSEEKYVAAAQKTADVLLDLQRSDGSLPGELDSNWRGSRWSCLTGDAQMALIWFRLYGLTHDPKYSRAGSAALAFVRQKQNLTSTNPAIRGGIPGSSPIWGPYERFKYPNWAVKFFIDALLAEEEQVKQAAPLAVHQDAVQFAAPAAPVRDNG